MDSASLDILTPVLDGIDRWAELAPLLPLLVLLELVLSADNAVALASITRQLNNLELQKKSLNIGIAISLILRIILILAANIIIKYSFIQLIAAIYLLSLCFNKFVFSDRNDNEDIIDKQTSNSFFKVTLLLALTDLAFSIDSVTAAVAISDQILLVITGAFVGVIALRFTTGFFIRWLEIFINLENAGYIAVGLVSIKLLIKLIFPELFIPEYTFFIILLLVFIWGFSKRIVNE
ncbi:TerC family protein [Prochlorococcus marinus]|uniref:TerC family protein n=1 Tax=Prochlorococcus marinus TaxID=1219 RepID=UPI0022B3BF86|nr:DUF475 domain-containing protein [Prochlorococcus marinus]